MIEGIFVIWLFNREYENGGIKEIRAGNLQKGEILGPGRPLSPKTGDQRDPLGGSCQHNHKWLAGVRWKMERQVRGTYNPSALVT